MARTSKRAWRWKLARCTNWNSVAGIHRVAADAGSGGRLGRLRHNGPSRSGPPSPPPTSVEALRCAATANNDFHPRAWSSDVVYHLARPIGRNQTTKKGPQITQISADLDSRCGSDASFPSLRYYPSKSLQGTKSLYHENTKGRKREDLSDRDCFLLCFHPFVTKSFAVGEGLGGLPGRKPALCNLRIPTGETASGAVRMGIRCALLGSTNGGEDCPTARRRLRARVGEVSFAERRGDGARHVGLGQ